MRIVLIITGGIASYKALEFIRLARAQGVLMASVLTRGGADFITPLAISGVGGGPVLEGFSPLHEGDNAMNHINLARQCDAIVVAPATAHMLAQMAHGLASDLASTMLLATDKPVMVAPAMNVAMWAHPATQANVALLRARGVIFIGPEDGEMACGEFGPGRMAEPQAILQALMGGRMGQGQELEGQELAGKRALVTAGPTAEALDAVRVLTNRSSGKQGYAIAEALAARGAQVTLVSGPVALEAPAQVERVMVESGAAMLQACRDSLPADIAVCCAAVCDFKPRSVPGKLKKTGSAMTLDSEGVPDILATLAHGELEGLPQEHRRPALIVGFAAETEDLEASAQDKRTRKGCDWMVANDVSGGKVFGQDQTQVLVLTEESAEHWPVLSKQQVAERLVAKMVRRLGG